jgi:tetratricopeptide (TPR) repeat protein
MRKRRVATLLEGLPSLAFSLALVAGSSFTHMAGVSAAPEPGGAGAGTAAAALEQTFRQKQQKVLDLEHQGDKKGALEVIKSAAAALKSLPPYGDHLSQLRVRQAELELQNKLQIDCFQSVDKIIADNIKIASNAGNDGDLWLEIGYLKDLLLRYAEDNDSLQAFKLAHKLCESFRETRCKPRDTLEPLCRSEVKHKDWVGLEKSAGDLLRISDNSLTQLTSLAMLQLSFSKQGKKKQAKEVGDRLQKLTPETSANERVWHREMALVNKSVLNYNIALIEINKALSLDEKLPHASGQTQIATDLGIKAEIESAAGQFDDAIKDAREADKLWNNCDPAVWKSSYSRTLTLCHADALGALEQACRAKHLLKEADDARARRRQILYIR